MSFIAIAPAPNANPSKDVIENDGWFPAISLTQLRETMRLDGTVTEARLKAAAIYALVSVNQQLTEWKHQQQQRGYGSLAQVPASYLGEENQLLHLYRRAVFSTTKADLLEKMRDYDSTASSLNDKKTLDYLNQAPEEERRNAHWAIADIVGRPHMTVELI